MPIAYQSSNRGVLERKSHRMPLWRRAGLLMLAMLLVFLLVSRMVP